MAGPSTFIAPSAPRDRRRLGKYEVLCRLTTGGMSQIFLAAQQGVGGFNKLVVLKMILPDIVGEEDFVRMFLEEARTTAAFNHPHIAQVYELDTADDVLFMAMEFVQGCTLVEMARACRQAKEPIPIGFTLAAVRDTALALHYAHTFVDARGRRRIVIHRDVAEKNIMVTYEGVSKLLDFGIAKALGRAGRTSAGMVKGTSGYMSPEQIRGESLDPRSDVFSTGVVLHECLTGLRLFHGKNAEEGMMAALKGEVAPPSKWNPLVPPEVDAIVMKALKREREARFGTALELARALERAAPGAIWHPEESGELVVRHFTERRAETRRVLEAAMGPENTSEVRVETIIAKMRAASDRRSDATPAPLAQTMASPPVASLSSTQPGILLEQVVSGGDGLTTPARGRLGRGSMASSPSPRPSLPPSPAPAARVINLPQVPEEDDSFAKTIPAAALPEEIREMRAKLARRPAPAPTPPPAFEAVTDARVVYPARAVTDETVSITPQGEPEREPAFPVAEAPSEEDLSPVPQGRSGLYEPLEEASPPLRSSYRTVVVGAIIVTLAAVAAALLALGLIPGLGS